MVGLGVQRFLKVHNAENQVAALQRQVTSIKVQIPKYNKVQQERAEILGLAAISQPIVAHEVYWPGVLTALANATPAGGTVLSFSGTANPPVATTATTGTTVLPPSATQIATLGISLQSPTGYTYFRSWYYSVGGSGKLTVNGFSGLSKAAATQVSFSATLGVTAEITSIRSTEFQVPR
jgi:hypothetical protein